MKDIHPVLLSLIVVFGLNLLGFVYGFLRQSDKLTDLTYSVSFIVAASVSLIATGNGSLANIVLLVMVSVWGFRLASYLFVRIQRMGHDARFDDMRPSLIRLGGFWLLQAVTVWIVLLPVSLFFPQSQAEGLTLLQWIAASIWLVGLLLESVADSQKFRFKNKAANKGKFVDAGLWSILRHPNYTGEIMVWIGVFLFTVPVLHGAQWVSVVSPLWIVFLLVFVSGVPLLEKSWEKRYGDDPAWKAYKRRTDRLIPRVY